MNRIIKKLKKEIEKELLELEKREEIIPLATVKEYREREIAFAEDVLDVIFPESFRKFLFKKKGGFVVNKQEILGLPIDKKKPSILEATKLLRIKRPDLSTWLICISFTNDRALCLDMINGNQLDASIVEVFLEKDGHPILFSKSFKNFIKTGKKTPTPKEIKNLVTPKEKIRVIR